MRLMERDSQEALGHVLQRRRTASASCNGMQWPPKPSLIITGTRANGREPQSVRMPIASLWTGLQRCLSYEALQLYSHVKQSSNGNAKGSAKSPLQSRPRFPS